MCQQLRSIQINPVRPAQPMNSSRHSVQGSRLAVDAVDDGGGTRNVRSGLLP
jgi:hypothetical protein